MPPWTLEELKSCAASPEELKSYAASLVLATLI